MMLPPPTRGAPLELAEAVRAGAAELVVLRRTGCGGGGVNPVSSRASRSAFGASFLGFCAVFTSATVGDSSPPQSTNNNAMTAMLQNANIANTIAYTRLDWTRFSFCATSAAGPVAR